MRTLNLLASVLLSVGCVQASAVPVYDWEGDDYNSHVKDLLRRALEEVEPTPDSFNISLGRKVAIIGAGAGGTSAAYHLRKYLNNCTSIPNVDITIFERRSWIGGRSQTTNAFGDPNYPVEMGGSVFIQKNPILVEVAAELGIPTIPDPGRPVALPTPYPNAPNETVKPVSMWDGNGIVFEFANSADIVARYGTSAPATVAGMAADVINKFLNIYNPQNFPFTNIKATFDNLGIGNLVSMTGKDWFVGANAWTNYVWEWVQLLTRSNYVQNVNKINAFGNALSLSVIQARVIDGGIWKLFSAMATASGATVKLNTQVTTVFKIGSKYLITWKDLNTQATSAGLYDSLIIASPYHQTDIFYGPGVIETVPIDAEFATLHATAFSTNVPRFNSSFFNEPANTLVPFAVFSILPQECMSLPSGADCTVNNQNFNKFNAITPVRTAINPATNQQQFVWKLFSYTRPSAKFFTELLGQSDVHTPANELDDPPALDWVDRWEWKAFPNLVPRTQFDPIRLDSGSGWQGSVWYPNAIELFASIMELSALSGKNVARHLAGLMAGSNSSVCFPQAA